MADTGGNPVPLQRLSTSRVYVVIPTSAAAAPISDIVAVFVSGDHPVRIVVLYKQPGSYCDASHLRRRGGPGRNLNL